MANQAQGPFVGSLSIRDKRAFPSFDKLGTNGVHNGA